jgi:holin-like protein
MFLLFGLLSTRAVRVEWIEECTSFLTRHLAFFFVPITVGLMAYGSLLKQDGAAILVTLVASAAAGMAVTGLTAQVLARRRESLLDTKRGLSS